MDQLFSQMWKGFQSLPASRKLTMAAAVAATLASIALAVVFINQPDYKVLYTNLSTEDAGQITSRLQEKKIPFQLSPGGDTISVAAEKVSELRLELAASGLPKGGGVGFEIFDTKNLGVTEFVQQLNLQRALQGELTRTINSLDEIQQSRVHLAIPKKSLFAEDRKKPTASVIVKLKSGRNLSEQQIQGIAHLVSSSIEGMSPRDVMIVDSSGKVLS
ncbi:MAG TPA: flagellar basal-body MS-ring/collar protein FliF, partial [Syntrophales bacterium]|nr:flagellar basal-body MS-ring/collar protein FliF [Syntrophales bacterium]